MTVSLVVAMAANRVIGKSGGLPWRLPGDLRFFKAVTMGKPLIMGRKTYESIGRPLPGRANIVVTRTGEVNAEGITVTHDFHEALKLARAIAAGNETDEVMVIGGGDIYRQALPLADRIYLTEIHAEFDGDTFFPPLGERWHEVSRTPGTPPEGGPAYDFVVLERR
jgi:dihydrofolate reductase